MIYTLELRKNHNHLEIETLSSMLFLNCAFDVVVEMRNLKRIPYSYYNRLKFENLIFVILNFKLLINCSLIQIMSFIFIGLYQFKSNKKIKVTK